MSTEYREIIDAFRKGNVFLHGPGGTGKSYTIGKIMGTLSDEKIYCTASTGIAAVNLNTDEFKATTLHKWTGLMLCEKPVYECVDIIVKKFPLKRRWLSTKYLIIDEISMIGGEFFDKLDQIARIVRGYDIPFGGIHILASGDFLQLPPVNGSWVFLSDAWKNMNFKVFNFTKPQRYPSLFWFEFLTRCREGKVNRDDLLMLDERTQAYRKYVKMFKTPEMSQEELNELNAIKCSICLSSDCSIPFAKSGCACFNAKSAFMHSECLVGWLVTSSQKSCPMCKTKFSLEFQNSVMYGNDKDENGEFKVKPTILYSTRAEVDDLNTYEIDRLPTEEITLAAIDTYYDIKTNKTKNEPQPVFNDVIPEKIKLKVGSQVMLKWNVCTEMGLANGTRGVVVEFKRFDSSPSVERKPDNYLIRVRWYNGLVTEVTPETWKVEDDFCIRSRTQMPLVLAWALTIHKSQGSTLDYVICDLGSSVFAPGQAYVALSRVKTMEGLLISQIDYSCLFKQDKRAIEYINKLKQ